MKVLENRDEGIPLAAPVIMELIEAVHEKGSSFRFQARGFSMTPAIRNGDVITVAPLKDMKIGRGSIMAFRHPERSQLLVHRVLRKKGNFFFIKGDNCSTADGWVPLQNLLGVVTRVERHGKARFWPVRSEAFFRSTICLFIYLLWLPMRRILVKVWRFMHRITLPGNEK